MSGSTLSLLKHPLPTDKAVVGYCRGERGAAYALCCNAMEQDASATASPGSVLLGRPTEGAWEVLAQLPDLSLRSLCWTRDGSLFACGMAGACVEYVVGKRELKRHATGARDILWRVHGLRRDAVFAVGENALLRFDGSAFRPIDLVNALGPNAWPTLLDVSAADEQVVAVGTQVEGSCVVRLDRSGVLFAEPVSAHSLYACAALGPDDALAMANDGVWRRGPSGWTRAVDLSGEALRPFGRPGCVALDGGRIRFASVDGVDAVRALLTDRGSLEARRVNVWVGSEVHRLALDPKLGATSLEIDQGCLWIGMAGQLWECALP